jgi:sigma-B regulation protein RsbU (phosphoserine phosphatase)
MLASMLQTGVAMTTASLTLTAHAAPRGHQAPEPLQAIVVEDDALERLRISRIVSRAGFEVREATDVPEAVMLHARLKADVVVSDWQLPSMSGLDLCRTLAASAGRPHMIMVTARDDVSDLAEAIEAGADDFITKPFRSAELQARLQAGRRIASMRRQLVERGRTFERALSCREDERAAVDQELRVAAVLQAEMLDQFTRPVPGFRCATVFRPASRLGGDLFGLLPTGPSSLAFFHLDATGHGIAAALQAFSTAARLQAIVSRREGPVDPAAILADLNEHAGAQGMSCTMALGTLDRRTGSGRVCLAGHPRPVLCGPGARAEAIGRGGLPIGALEESRWRATDFTLGTGQALVLHSDGFPDACNARDDHFGTARLHAALTGTPSGSVEQLTRAATLALDAWREGHPPDDDISMLAIAIEGESVELP